MPKPTVVLIGPPGAGKTSIGTRVARALGTTFTDSDELIAAQCGKPCGEVFTALGEEKFRELETQVISEALTEKGILALGGGAVISESVRHLLQGQFVVWVSVDAEEGFARTQAQGGRPLLEVDDPQARYEELLAARQHLYKACSDFKVRTEHRTPQQIVADILNWLEDHDTDS